MKNTLKKVQKLRKSEVIVKKEDKVENESTKQEVPGKETSPK